MGFKQLTTQQGEKLSQIKNLDPQNKLKDLTLHEEYLEPGCRSSRSHFHSSKQECVFVLKGQLSVYENEDKVAEIAEGENFLFPPQKNIYHYLKNDSDLRAHYLNIATGFQNDKVSFKD